MKESEKTLQNYNSIIQHYKKTNEKYSDPDFIAENGQRLEKYYNTDIFKNISQDGIRQGSFPDCFLLCCCIQLASNIEYIKQCNEYVYILYTKKITKHIINTLVDDVNSLIKDIMYKNGGNIFPMFPECIGYVYKKYSLLPLCKPREYLVINENILINYLKNKINE